MDAITLYRPDLGSIARLAVDAQRNENTARAYARAINRYVEWHVQQDQPFSRRTVQAWLKETGAGNQELSALRTLAREAYQNGLIDDATTYGITMIPGVRHEGRKSGNWLEKPALARLLEVAADRPRDLAMIHLLTYGALRREEVVGLDCEQLVQRSGRWVLLDVKRKRNRIQTIPLLDTTAWVVGSWIQGKTGKMFPITSRRLYDIVRELAGLAGIEDLGCHDLRRTGAALMRTAGAPLEKIQKHLGHASIMTTTIYLQDVDDLSDSAIDYLPKNSG